MARKRISTSTMCFVITGLVLLLMVYLTVLITTFLPEHMGRGQAVHVRKNEYHPTHTHKKSETHYAQTLHQGTSYMRSYTVKEQSHGYFNDMPEVDWNRLGGIHCEERASQVAAAAADPSQAWEAVWGTTFSCLFERKLTGRRWLCDPHRMHRHHAVTIQEGHRSEAPDECVIYTVQTDLAEDLMFEREMAEATDCAVHVVVFDDRDTGPATSAGLSMYRWNRDQPLVDVLAAGGLINVLAVNVNDERDLIFDREFFEVAKARDIRIRQIVLVFAADARLSNERVNGVLQVMAENEMAMFHKDVGASLRGGDSPLPSTLSFIHVSFPCVEGHLEVQGKTVSGLAFDEGKAFAHASKKAKQKSWWTR